MKLSSDIVLGILLGLILGCSYIENWSLFNFMVLLAIWFVIAELYSIKDKLR